MSEKLKMNQTIKQRGFSKIVITINSFFKIDPFLTFKFNNPIHMKSPSMLLPIFVFDGTRVCFYLCLGMF
jgi:hypothetical protein